MDWEQIGRKLGYPECCIKQPDYEAGIHFNGFVPCNIHNKLTLEGIVKLIGRNPENTPDWLFTERI